MIMNLKANKIETKDKIEPLTSGMSLKKSWELIAVN